MDILIDNYIYKQRGIKMARQEDRQRERKQVFRDSFAIWTLKCVTHLKPFLAMNELGM